VTGGWSADPNQYKDSAGVTTRVLPWRDKPRGDDREDKQEQDRGYSRDAHVQEQGPPIPALPEDGQRDKSKGRTAQHHNSKV
jgi:hypothetical protein